MWKTFYFLSGNSWTSLRKQVKHYIFLLKLRGNGNFHLFSTFLSPFSLSLFFAGVPWQMTSGTKALALKNWNAFASREGALLCSAGADTARLFRHLNKSASQKKSTAASWLCETPLSYQYRKTAVSFFAGSGAAIFLGSVTGSFRILRSGAHLLTSCTRRIPTYMMRLRYFRNHDKSILQSGTHAWAPCTHKNLRFRDAHFYLSKRKGGFLMTEMRNYGKIVLRAKYFLWN